MFYNEVSNISENLSLIFISIINYLNTSMRKTKIDNILRIFLFQAMLSKFMLSSSLYENIRLIKL